MGKVLIITTDPALIQSVTPAMQGRDLQIAHFPTVRDAVVRIGTEDIAGVVADISRIAPAERQQLFQVHKDKSFPLFILDTISSVSPAESMPLRRLSMPFPNGFTDQIRAVERPIVFLVDQALYASRGIQIVLQQAGVTADAIDNAQNLAVALQQREAARTTTTTSTTKKSLWDTLTSKGPAPAADQPAAPGGRRVVVVQFPGTNAEADQLDAKLREQVPNAVVYYISSLELVRAAALAIKQGTPAAMMREQAPKIAAVLAEGMQAASAAGSQQRGKEKLLLLDNDKTVLDVLSETMTAAGYEVTATQDPEHALRLATVKGAFHLAALGITLNYAKITARDLAQRLRDADPDLRMIFMIDRSDPAATLKNIGDVVGLGVDAALIKPVQPSQVLFFAQRALDQRFMKFENARLQREAEDSARKLAQVNGFQTKFFATVAHDVKNPLTAILGYSEVLSMRLKEQPNELKCASHIHSAAKTLNLLISDLVDLAAIESGKLRVQIGALELPQVLNEVKSRIEVVANQRQIKFGISCPAELPQLQGDPGRLGQVIQNLCTNGIQYTKEGGSVTVDVQCDTDWVIVSVRDTGIGIKKEDLPRVFERFFQTAEAQQMRKAGFGLGLKISREIVQMHGGDLGLESEFGKGSRFFFSIPTVKAQGAPRSPNPATPPTSTTVAVTGGAPAPAPAPAPIPAPVATPAPTMAPAPAPVAPAPAPTPAPTPAPVTQAPAPVAPPPVAAPNPNLPPSAFWPTSTKKPS